MSDISASDLVWNRATELVDPRPGTAPGDAALAAVLLCHGMAMNGGLLHACDGLAADQLARAVSGYRFFGLDDVADLVSDVARQATALDPDDLDTGERLEVESNQRFHELVPDDDTVVRAFEAHHRDHPEAYAPV
jgi:hypothetical protein